MKKWGILFCLLGVFGPFVHAAPVHHITAETSRMEEGTLKHLFSLKEGEEFVEDTYQKAQADLEKLHFFRTLQFLYKEDKHGVDIHIKADDHAYVLPLLFAFSSSKRSVGLKLESGNLFKQGETSFVAGAVSRDGFDLQSGFAVGKHNFSASYTHLNFEQYFYANGWMSAPDVYVSADDKNKHDSFIIGQVRTRQDTASFSYSYQLSHVWSVFVAPAYDYYRYNNPLLDSGNHSTLSFGGQYADDVGSGVNMKQLAEIPAARKDSILRDLPRVRQGKLATVSYTTGSRWTGSDYAIDKISVGGAYVWEFKSHHRLGLFAKGARAFAAPFSSQIESTDLLFGLGIYDREQRGKGGVSGGVSLTYFLVRNRIGALAVMPFYEAAYVTSGGHSYQSHSGAGANISYRFWRIPWPLGFNYTHNLDDGSHHIGLKVGGRF